VEETRTCAATGCIESTARIEWKWCAATPATGKNERADALATRACCRHNNADMRNHSRYENHRPRPNQGHRIIEVAEWKCQPRLTGNHSAPLCEPGSRHRRRRDAGARHHAGFLRYKPRFGDIAQEFVTHRGPNSYSQCAVHWAPQHGTAPAGDGAVSNWCDGWTDTLAWPRRCTPASATIRCACKRLWRRQTRPDAAWRIARLRTTGRRSTWPLLGVRKAVDRLEARSARPPGLPRARVPGLSCCTRFRHLMRMPSCSRQSTPKGRGTCLGAPARSDGHLPASDDAGKGSGLTAWLSRNGLTCTASCAGDGCSPAC